MSQKSLPLTTVVVPVYNERSTLEATLRGLLGLEIPLEIIVVDDGSSDGSRQLISAFSGITSLFHAENRGKGAAVRTGLAAATGECVVIFDADGEYLPTDVHRLVVHQQQHALDVVYGSRYLGNARDRRLFYYGVKFLNFVLWLCFKKWLSDEATCLKLVRRSVLLDLQLNSTGFELCAEMNAKLLKRGYEIVEIPVSYAPRGRSEGKKIKVRDGWKSLLKIFRVRFSS